MDYTLKHLPKHKIMFIDTQIKVSKRQRGTDALYDSGESSIMLIGPRIQINYTSLGRGCHNITKGSQSEYGYRQDCNYQCRLTATPPSFFTSPDKQAPSL